jgi:hypothetical protein
VVVGSSLPGHAPSGKREPSSPSQWRDRAGFAPASPTAMAIQFSKPARTLEIAGRAVKRGAPAKAKARPVRAPRPCARPRNFETRGKRAASNARHLVPLGKSPNSKPHRNVPSGDGHSFIARQARLWRCPRNRLRTRQDHQAPTCELDILDRVGGGDATPRAFLINGILTGEAPAKAVKLGSA